MIYGIASVGIVPMRAENTSRSEMVSQLLYGELFGIVERRGTWSRICTCLDNYEGWIDNQQFIPITERQVKKLLKRKPKFTFSESSFVRDKVQGDQKMMIPMGAVVSNALEINHTFRSKRQASLPFSKVVEVAHKYLNAPYLWGGRTPFGIDCSGFVQMVYRLCGVELPRDASQQVKHGTTLSFLEECQAGDLAFFDNEEGDIIHVGIVLSDNRIIHAHGKVRVDFIDHGGIYNAQTNQYSHQLRVLKTFREN